ncbi:MAG TPA: glycosyltransferase family 2 protein [Candidatus Saccharimonadales bacterium]|nr:glycosyltransferase family 2 protein [Candidatus Saccharimonadales bacterium]
MTKSQDSRTSTPQKISIVIPALNEEEGIGPVLQAIPIKALQRMNYEVELLVIDNGSTDKTPHIARDHGATVIIQPIRGYGNAYKAGFANATGDIIATGDADLTYPFDDLPNILKKMHKENIDFVTTDRLSTLNAGAMTKFHQFGNWVLSSMTKILYKCPFNDSQSGMWIFKSSIWPQLDVRSSGMPFSQEIKLEAFCKGFKCIELPIEYRARAGKEKLMLGDGPGNIYHLLKKRITIRHKSAVPIVVTTDVEQPIEQV